VRPTSAAAISLNRRNFPWVTLALILANVWVFVFLQVPDGKILDQAGHYYFDSGLADIEFPAHVRWMREHDADARKIQVAESGRPEARFYLVMEDVPFHDALLGDQVITPSSPDYADWHRKRAEFDGLIDSTFTESHVMRHSRFEPSRILWSMWMHGGVDHIVGNMVFLAILGLLVEPALGAGWYLGLYLVGGIGAALMSLLTHWGGTIPGSLGASGAIAAVMGAFCVIWGFRKVRVFYWIFVYFDYRRVPALLLLPFWFAMLVILPWLDPKSHIDFQDHLGGIVTGVGLAFVLRRFGAVREDFIDEDLRVEAQAVEEEAFGKAQQLIGQLEIAKARDILLKIDQADPGQLRVALALYRCARYRGHPAEMDAAIARVIAHPVKGDAQAREVRDAYLDYAKACNGMPRLAPEVLMGLLPLCQRLGDDATTESLLRDVARSAPDASGLAAAWFALAMRTPDGTAKRRERLAYLLEHHGASEFAPKARFLLGDG